MRTIKLATAGMLAMAVVGCSSVQEPTASVRSAALQGVTADGMTLNLGVEVNNPNSVALPLGKTSYSLAFGNVKVLDGSATPDGNIPANGNRTVTVPINIRWQDLLKAEQAITSSGGNIPYSVSGNLGLKTGLPLFGNKSVPLNYSGTLALRDWLKDPMTLLRSPAARALAEKVLGGRFGL